MSIEEEFKAAKIAYDCMGMMNAPTDVLEAVISYANYKKAQQRYFIAEKKLMESKEANNG